ncbi:macro domain-containing protein XAC3343 isoform X3 [Ricinus communis]|uniref:macro domain-containing protein XAC3343 isoform X3 n=1 Tax=Ricinus communis TaxID=3988 RepID=UPI00201A9F6C|nr:macro domain-containing protein XAC3343 isoform X3 [Ricinus communis]
MEKNIRFLLFLIYLVFSLKHPFTRLLDGSRLALVFSTLKRHLFFLEQLHVARILPLPPSPPPLTLLIMPMDISAGVSPASFRFPMTSSEVVFPLSSSCLLKLNRGNITNWFVNSSSDAIVNSTNMLMHALGGADADIHEAAGPRLAYACDDIPVVRDEVRCPTGEARITQGFELPVSRVIHTVGPVHSDDRNPVLSLRNAYRNSLELAKANEIQYVAFPAVCCGTFGYPLEEAAMVAISTVKEFAHDFKEVHFVLLLDDVYNVWYEKTSQYLSLVMQHNCCTIL